MLGSRLSSKNPINTKNTTDPELIHREFYNPSNYDIILIRREEMIDYIFSQNIPLGLPNVLLKSKGFAYIPHGYYISWIKGPQHIKINIHTNFGDCIGKNIRNQDQANEYMIKIGAKKK